MNEETFWRHYFFRVKYIRLKLGMEKISISTDYLNQIKEIPEEKVIYKPTFVPPPKKVKPKQNDTPTSSTITKSTNNTTSSTMTNKTKSNIIDKKGGDDSHHSEVNDNDAEEEEEEDNHEEDVTGMTKEELEKRRKAEADLAAEVEAELDNDDIDLGDIGDDDLDGDDFDDLGDLMGDDEINMGEGDEEDDAELEAQIARELQGGKS